MCEAQLACKEESFIALPQNITESVYRGSFWCMVLVNEVETKVQATRSFTLDATLARPLSRRIPAAEGAPTRTFTLFLLLFLTITIHVIGRQKH